MKCIYSVQEVHKSEYEFVNARKLFSHLNERENWLFYKEIEPFAKLYFYERGVDSFLEQDSFLINQLPLVHLNASSREVDAQQWNLLLFLATST
ncbi:hypothetical protein ACIQW7_05420 [Peribacillus simplex]|uniref:hypothetical protein n=1 Tax=Peribacillus simplex TaxID=1478 RepID=UPI003822B4AC